WIFVAVLGISLLIHFGFNRVSSISWIAVFIFVLLTVFGSFGAAGKRWAQVGLLVPILIPFIYALDVCYAYLWHARFTGYFWTMLALAGWSLVTEFGTVICLCGIISRRDSKLTREP